MAMLITAAVTFLAIHLLIAGTRVRDAITGTIGERAYLGLFSLVSLVVIAWLAMSYTAAQASAGNRLLYDLGHVRDLGIPVIAIAFLLGVPGLLMPNPTTVMQEGAASKADTVKGVLRITRHPFLWSVAIWSAFHLVANGNLASVIFFGTFLVLALFGTVSIDAKRKRKLGEAWSSFAAKTSNIPFGAIVSGRNTPKLRELLDWREGVALLLFLIVLFAHAHIFGVSPFPLGAVPI